MAKEETFYFDRYINDLANNWGLPDFMVNGSITGTPANANQNGKFQVLDRNTSDGSEYGTISKVELRAFCNKDAAGTADITLTPIFGGSSDGDTHSLDEGTSPSGDWSSRIDITEDTNAPGTWDWEDVEDLDCKVVCVISSGAPNVRVWQVEIIVSYIRLGGVQSLFIQ